ncbi:hypothetical protein R1sor_007956 [Riccia sorocarpa]|uniref:Uncharacterized protein n=1 Tax=Riccia sorocarpa TaxID=122646 RepID=A0ABD3HRZ8_9MARC
MVALERADSNPQLHAQGVIFMETTSTKALKQEIAAHLGWKPSGPPDACDRATCPSNQVAGYTKDYQEASGNSVACGYTTGNHNYCRRGRHLFAYRRYRFSEDPFYEAAGVSRSYMEDPAEIVANSSDATESSRPLSVCQSCKKIHRTAIQRSGRSLRLSILPK